MRPRDLAIPWDLERAIDDFIFLCFSAGNDFLPGLPGFSIRGGAIDSIITTYRNQIGRLGAYITYNGGVDFPMVEAILACFTRGEPRELESIMYPSDRSTKLEKYINSILNTDEPVYVPTEVDDRSNASSSKVSRHESVDQHALKVEYYWRKFHFSKAEQETKVVAVVEEFIHGMIWILNYYLHGCQSWNWYYPYQYAPCASDFHNFNTNHSRYEFELGEPFLPLVQLIAVLPPQSSHCLPPIMRHLMTDPESPLKEFYPAKFLVDLNGETSEFHGVVKIPFIDEAKLQEALRSRDLALTPDELQRNRFGSTRLFLCAERAPPPDHLKVRVFGPTYWGFIERIPVPPSDIRNSFEFLYTQHEMPPRANLSMLVPGIVLPPWTLDIVGYDARKWSTKWDKGAFDCEEIERSYELPLEIPGVTPGADLLSRKKRVMIAHQRHQQQQFPHGYPRAPYPVPPGYPATGYPTGYPAPPPGYPQTAAPPMGYPTGYAPLPPGYLQQPIPVTALPPGCPQQPALAYPPGYPPTRPPVAYPPAPLALPGYPGPMVRPPTEPAPGQRRPRAGRLPH
jgi:hypothetical protein